MKISNETKIGVLTALALTLLILGFNFLKGKTFFGNKKTINAEFTNIQGLVNSNPVIINGMQVGSVYSIENAKDMKSIFVEMNLTKEVNIPKNSVALIRTNPLGTPSIEIKLGDATEYLKNSDSIRTAPSESFINAAVQKLDPVLNEVETTVKHLDSLLVSVNNIVDPLAKNNIQAILANLNQVTYSLTASTASLQKLLNTQTGALAQTLDNLNAITGNFANNSGKVNHIMDNLDKTTTRFAELNVKETMDTLNATIASLKSAMANLNNKNGTVGMLLNDPRLYNNLASTANKLNLLLDDIKTHPKRYVSISVFGKKNNTVPLAVPLPDTLNAPYLIKNIND